MPSWLLKAVTQRLIGFLPKPHYWNELLQTRLTGSIQLPPDEFVRKVGQCHSHFEHLRLSRRATSCNFVAFELGTGWFPVVPIGLFLCGAHQVWSWDITEHLTPARVRHVMDLFLQLGVAGELSKHLPGLLPDRLNKLRNVATCRSAAAPAELLNQIGIRYRIGDAMNSGLPSGTIDLFTSNSVLEFVPTEALVPLFREFLRMSAPGAVMSHRILMNDYYANFDRRITSYNFLKYSDRAWRWINNPIIPFNRLRIADYRRAVREAGFEIIDETVILRGDPEVLSKVRLAPRFRSQHEEDLLMLQVWLAATPAKNWRVNAPASKQELEC